jgi:hypothetical protein
LQNKLLYYTANPAADEEILLQISNPIHVADCFKATKEMRKKRPKTGLTGSRNVMDRLQDGLGHQRQMV